MSGKMIMDDTGYHYIIDVRVKDPDILRSSIQLRRIFESVLKEYTILKFGEYVFPTEGEGVTGFFLLSESHCSYHTYPESNYIAVDVFTCGRDPARAISRLTRMLGAEEETVRFLRRGSIAIAKPVALQGLTSGAVSPL